MIIKKSFTLILILITLGISISCRSRPSPPQISREGRFLMDTFVSIQIPKEEASDDAFEVAFKRMNEVYEKFSAHLPESPVYRFNNYGENISDEEIISLVRESIRISGESGGLFDITIYPLMRLWGFYEEEYRVPEEEEVIKALELIGADKLKFNEKGGLQGGKVRIDMGGIAKGYAVEAARDALKSEGIVNALIDAGGDIYVMGFRSPPEELHWRIGIKDPFSDGVVGILWINDLAVATSGGYERYFEVEGVRYHHILNPLSGYPSEEIASVTVISSEPATADAWSTAFFLMEPGRALKLASEKENMEAMIILHSGEELFTPGFKEYMR